MRRVILAAVALLVLLAMPRNAEACSCMQAGPACQAFWKTDARGQRFKNARATTPLLR